MAGELPQSYDSWKTAHEFPDDYEDENEGRCRKCWRLIEHCVCDE